MKQKFLGLNYFKDNSYTISQFAFNYLHLLLFVGLGYFFSAMIFGMGVDGDPVKYIQSVEKHYFMQTIIIAFGFVLCALMRYLIVHFNGKYFDKVGTNRSAQLIFYTKLDKFIYPALYVIIYLAVNEMFGL